MASTGRNIRYRQNTVAGRNGDSGVLYAFLRGMAGAVFFRASPSA